MEFGLYRYVHVLFSNAEQHQNLRTKTTELETTIINHHII